MPTPDRLGMTLHDRDLLISLAAQVVLRDVACVSDFFAWKVATGTLRRTSCMLTSQSEPDRRLHLPHPGLTVGNRSSIIDVGSHLAMRDRDGTCDRFFVRHHRRGQHSPAKPNHCVHIL
jgi:hypothetical protein